MAEEHLTEDEAFTHDDMTVLGVLMQEVKGLNVISSAPAYMSSDEKSTPTELDFDQTV